MTARSRGYNQDWDPMREDFDNSSYGPQNADERGSGFVNLDHCRLYITNIPRGLSDDGLYTAFSKYGQLTESFVHPEKKYALVGFETPGEAKLAMMKLNRMEPLRLNINIAHKSNSRPKKPFDQKDNSNSGYRNNLNGPRNRDDRSFRDDGSSGRSNPRRPDSLANGDNMEDLVDDDVHVLCGNLEPEVNLELEKLKLEHLKLQEAQVMCKHRMLLLKQAEKKSSTSSRQILPDGRIVVRTIEKGEVNDPDSSFGAGDASAGACVACGERASLFCSGCRVTPYCSPACQRRDWQHRHKTVCHNLKRQSGGVASRLDPEPESVIPAAAPLRRPRSPPAAAAAPAPVGDSAPDRMPPKKFGPPGIVTAPTPVNRSNNNMRGNDDNRRDNHTDNRRDNQSDNRRDNQSDYRRDNQDNRRPDNRGADNRRDNWESDRGRSDNRTENRGRSDNWGQDRGQSGRGRFNRSNDGDENRSRPNDRNRDTNYGRRDDRQDRPRTQDGGNRNFARPQSGGQGGKPRDDEDWGPKPVQQPEEPKPSFAFKPKTAVAPQEEPKTEPKVACAAAAASSPARPAAAAASPARPAAAAAAAATAAAPQPAQALVPKNCIVDLLPANDTFILTADSKAEDCDSGSGWICVTLHPDQSENYEKLLDPFGVACEASEPVKPKPGDTFAYLDPADSAWYRARCLSTSPARAALLDAARVVTLAAADGCRRLPADYADIPEFSAHLESDKVQPKDQVQCTVVSRSGRVVAVSLVHADSQAALGAGTLRRWSPRLDQPAPAPAPTPAPAPPQPPAPAASGPSDPPQVPRPPVTDRSSVLLADATAPERVFVRPADRAKQAEFDDLVYAVALYGKDNATKLKELPTQGEVVLALFTDDVHYRALVQRVSSKHRRCLLEYIEYGNVAIVEDTETLYACPEQFSLRARPTLTSHVTLQTQHDFCPAAAAYLERLKDDLTELTLTIPSGEKTGPSKTPVQLTVSQSKESVNRMVESLSMPEWKRLLERGGDVLETETFYYKDITYVEPPASGGEMEILDCSLLDRAGLVSGHLKNAEHARRAFALTPRIQEYCNSALAKDPYLPKAEELCIAMCPYRKQWLRGVLLQQEGGPGGAEAQILFYDYGHIPVLPVSQLRKMMPEFTREPAAVCTLEIKDFPEELLPGQVERARAHMRYSGHGPGVLLVTRVTRAAEPGEYCVEAPDLLRALRD